MYKVSVGDVQQEKKPIISNVINHLERTMPVRKELELEATHLPTHKSLCRGHKGGLAMLFVCMAPNRILAKIITIKLFREELS